MAVADSPSSSSKVMVQCVDPYGLFDKILPNLESRLPLGNLHWKPPTRPLRSIDKLNVAFIREARSSDSANTARRHQIPGLRPTPYVKIFLLRCDDKDNYKEGARKEVKQWLKAQDLSTDGKTSKKGQERHDAFEYLIVHVVLPGTPAAAQPRTSKHIPAEAADSTDSVNNKSKWPGKGSTTIYDKLRADFASSKAPFERVAQIRVQDTTAPASGLGFSEVEEQWQDLIDKLKIAILQSFDARISQYEEDIKERDSQRSLPGWNFCTFFILKEGLARGFENVGLVDDSLTIYDELDLGLDHIVQEQAKQGDTDSAGALLPYSQDLKPAIRKALDTIDHEPSNSTASTNVDDLGALFALEKTSIPLDTSKVDYQQRILTNQVSALDLRMYMYTRRLRLMFRKARNATLSGKSKNTSKGPQYDIGVVCEICAQASEFINFAARALRHDLYGAWGGHDGLSDEEHETQDFVIDNLVASWKVSAILQILEECQVSTILADCLVNSVDKPVTHDMIDEGNVFPARHMSTRPSSGSQVSDPPPNDRRQSVIIPLQQPNQPTRELSRPDNHARLGLWAAELLVTLRSVIRHANPTALEGLFQQSKSTLMNEQHSNTKYRASGIQSATLQAVAKSKTLCLQLFRLLTIHAHQCYDLASQSQASRRMLLELAQIDLKTKNGSEAVRWLEQASRLIDSQARTLTDLAILELYASCLDKDGSSSQYAKCLIRILKSVTNIGSVMLTKSGINLQSTLDQLIAVSAYNDRYELPFDLLFSVKNTERYVTHTNADGGFSLAISLVLRLPVKLSAVYSARLRLTALDVSRQSEIVMQGIIPDSLDQAALHVAFDSNITTIGSYKIESLEIIVARLSFTYNFGDVPQIEDIAHRPLSKADSSIVVFPAPGALTIDAEPCPETDLTATRMIRLIVKAGTSALSEALVRVKPATGGCRLDVQETVWQKSQPRQHFEIVVIDGVSVIKLTNLSSRTEVVFDIPFTIENPTVPTLEIRLEAGYETPHGRFDARFSSSVDIRLPISVNVQDIFQARGVFSRFTAGPVGDSPTRIVSWELGNDDSYELTQSTISHQDTIAFQKMPASWMVKLQKKPGLLTSEGRFPLKVKFQCMEDVVLGIIIHAFLRDIAQSLLGFATPLLVSHLRSQLQRTWTSQQLEACALLREVRLWSYGEMQWEGIIANLNANVQADAEVWLRTWHTNNIRLKLDFSHAAIRTLRLVVDLPQPPLVISTRLRLPSNSVSTHSRLGEPIPTELAITCDRVPAEGIEIHYEIVGQADTWLLGGRRKGILSAIAGRQLQPMVLIPQRTGHLLLPSIEIRCRRTNASEDSAVVACEVESRSQAQSILVVSGVRSATFAMGPGGVVGDYLLLDVRR